jgi:hypothetical protein
MRDSIQKGIMFNIIDSSRGEKADLVPLTMEPRYQQAFQRRVRQMIDLPQIEPFEVWCARPEDVIIGKLMAWVEGRPRRHETDIYEMMVFHYLRLDPQLSADFDETLITVQALSLGAEVDALWQSILTAAQQTANQAGPAKGEAGSN